MTGGNGDSSLVDLVTRPDVVVTYTIHQSSVGRYREKTLTHRSPRTTISETLNLTTAKDFRPLHSFFRKTSSIVDRNFLSVPHQYPARTRLFPEGDVVSGSTNQTVSG